MILYISIYIYILYFIIVDIMYIIAIQDGCTALLSACWDGHLSVVELLLQYNADIHVQNNVRNTYICLYHICSVIHIFNVRMPILYIYL